MGLHCQILIQRPREGVHAAGSAVIGTVKYALDEPAEYNDIILSLIGKGECSWSERKRHRSGHRNSTHTRNKYYKGTQIFVSNNVSILNKLPGYTSLLLAGTYEYNFRFMLPEHIPPSFKDSTCTIAYKIKLKFEKPNFFSVDKIFTSMINVYGLVKPTAPEGNSLFGLEKSLLRPFSKRSHIINVKASISNIIYSPGDNADISFTVSNISDVKVTSIKTELLCHTTYTANCGRKKETTKVIKESTVETPNVPPDSVANMASVLPIQAHLYSIQNCKIMEKEYKVKLTLRLPMPYINSSVEIPIVIGETYNERNVDVATVARYVHMPGPSGEAVEATGNGLPSYWEAMNEDCDDNDLKVKG